MPIKYSIIIPVKEVNNYIRETVTCILDLDYDSWELIILPNDIFINEWSSEKIKIIPTGRLGPAAKRDIGAQKSNGQILVFLDDDSFPEKNLLSIANEYIDDEDIVAIGGPGITPHSDTFWQKVSGAVFLSKYSGGAPERYAEIGDVKAVVDWPSVNLMVKKKDFVSIGGFDTQYWPGEDTKLCSDLIKSSNKKILYIPKMVVWHHRRSGLLKHLLQIGGYGLHRGFFAKKFPETSRKLQYFLPSLFVIYLVAIIFYYIISGQDQKIYLVPLCIYLLMVIAAFFDIGKKMDYKIALCTIPYIFLTHIYYGMRFMEGILSTKITSRLR